MGRKWVINGVEYNSYIEAIRDTKANIYNLNENTVRTRIKRGQTLEQALCHPLSIRRAKACVANGIKYESVAEVIRCSVANPYNLARETVQSRVRRGQTLEQSLRQPLSSSRNKAYIVNETRYESITSALQDPKANPYNICEKAARSRLRRGKTLEQALSYPGNGRHPIHPCIVNGVWYNSLKEAARDNRANPNKIPYNTICRRVKRLKCSIDEAFVIPSGCLHKESDKWEMAIKESKIKKGKIYDDELD